MRLEENKKTRWFELKYEMWQISINKEIEEPSIEFKKKDCTMWNQQIIISNSAIGINIFMVEAATQPQTLAVPNKRRRVRNPEVQQFQQAALQTVESSQDPFA